MQRRRRKKKPARDHAAAIEPEVWTTPSGPYRLKETARSHWHRSLEKAQQGVDCLREGMLDLRQLTYATASNSNQQEYVLTNLIPGTFSAQQGVHRQALTLVATLKQLERDSSDLTKAMRPRPQYDEHNAASSPSPSKSHSFDRRALRKLRLLQQETDELLEQATSLIQVQKATMIKKRSDESAEDALERQLKKKLARNVAISKSQSALDFVLWKHPNERGAGLRAAELDSAEMAAAAAEDEARGEAERKQKPRVRVDFAEFIRYHWIRFVASASTTTADLATDLADATAPDNANEGGGVATATADTKAISSKLASILSASVSYGRFCALTKCMGLMLTPQVHSSAA
jgi:hypothetical protein